MSSVPRTLSANMYYWAVGTLETTALRSQSLWEGLGIAIAPPWSDRFYA